MISYNWITRRISIYSTISIVINARLNITAIRRRNSCRYRFSIVYSSFNLFPFAFTVFMIIKKPQIGCVQCFRLTSRDSFHCICGSAFIYIIIFLFSVYAVCAFINSHEIRYFYMFIYFIICSISIIIFNFNFMWTTVFII